MAMDEKDMRLDWDDAIEDDGKGFVLLKEGDYEFTVTGFERGHFNGSAKIPACNKAALTLAVKSAEGNATIKTDLILYKSLEWKLSSFFRSIGQKKHGERLQMNWASVPGSIGKAHIIVRTWTGNDGKEHEANDVGYYIDTNADSNGFREVSQSAEKVEDLPF